MTIGGGEKGGSGETLFCVIDNKLRSLTGDDDFVRVSVEDEK